MTSKNIIKFKATGVAPLLMHSDRYSNPLDPLTKKHKELTGKRKKTEEDHIAIMHSEWLGSLYVDGVNGSSRLYIPGAVVEAALLEAAKMQKLGKNFKRGLTVIEDKCEFQYNGPKKIDELWDDPNFRDIRGVRVSQAKVQRCRPKFDEWSVTFTVAYHDRMVQRQEILKAVQDAGDFVGLCDFRPKFGRFEVKEV